MAYGEGAAETNQSRRPFIAIETLTTAISGA